MDIEKFLSGFFKGTKNPTLKAMEYFMNEFNHPEKDLKVIHIAGTNGKGSCTEMITNILISAEYKVGKFISPHLIKYNERISIQNKNISDDEMESIICEIQPKIEKYERLTKREVTLFELETTMAILYFSRNNCDFVVMEVGLGGTYDCTNIVSPLVSIITSVGFDHMHILGNTLKEIAENKAGIIKENSETIYFEQEECDVNDVIYKKCIEKNNLLHLIKNTDISNYYYDNDFQWFDYKKHKKIKVVLKGKKQVHNACICLECIEALNSKGYAISENSIRTGLETVIHKGRFETICNNPVVIYDGAHNEPAIENFVNSVKMYYENKPKVYIISILKSKDSDTVIKKLSKDEEAVFIFTDGNDKERYTSKELLLNEMKKYSYNKNLFMMNLDDAVVEALKYKTSVIFVVGSFYIYGDVINLLKKQKNDSV